MEGLASAAHSKMKIDAIAAAGLSNFKTDNTAPFAGRSIVKAICRSGAWTVREFPSCSRNHKYPFMISQYAAIL